MDILSILLLVGVVLWFLWALKKVISGGTCGCGGNKKSSCHNCSCCEKSCPGKK